MTDGLQLVWFKRDLRIADHQPLSRAAERGPVLPLFIIEPEQLNTEDFDARHWRFAMECLIDLRNRLLELGQPLVVRFGEALAVLQQIVREQNVTAIWAHEETFNWLSYERDRRIRAWARDVGLPFVELSKDGVVRRLPGRDAWSGIWERRMTEPIVPAPLHLTLIPDLELGEIPDSRSLGLRPSIERIVQSGGSVEVDRLLDSFLHERGESYTKAMSSPLLAEDACSRISPHLAMGTISMRQVVHTLRNRIDELRAAPPDARGTWLQAMSSFNARLHWRDHFIQKLEDEPEIEFRNFMRAYDGIREVSPVPEAAERFAAGQTGYPLIDACMRALDATGWINFRMRALLVSFATYDLWLDWHPVGLVLARRFLDFEPGIHWSQHQMQAGTTGINTIRLYDPTKQAIDQDPTGTFIRRWVPELENVAPGWIHRPWTMPGDEQARSNCRIGTDYPVPIVDHELAARRAKEIIYAIRKRPETRAEAELVQFRHGSRKSPGRGDSGRPSRPSNQLSLDLPVG